MRLLRSLIKRLPEEALFDALLASLAEHDLPVESTPRPETFDVLRFTRPPAALVELGFLCSTEGAERLEDPDVQRRAGLAVAEGVVRWWGEWVRPRRDSA